jgi:ketosteroid isomerase-like protein
MDSPLPATRNSLTAGDFEGRDAVGQWFADWLTIFESGHHLDIEEAQALGCRRLPRRQPHGRGRTSGVEVHGRSGYVYTLRDGKIVRVELFADSAAALEAAGLDE